jgi:toxin-antitoxin system PIN domain toxin
VIAVDSNLLVYAHRVDSPWHEPAARRLRELAEGRLSWAIPWPCLHEFIAIVTHPRVYKPPTPMQTALDQVDAWLESPSVVLLTEGPSHWTHLRGMLLAARASGPQVHDARVAAMCAQHGVRELWSADRDFGRFPDLTVRNPLLG